MGRLRARGGELLRVRVLVFVSTVVFVRHVLNMNICVCMYSGQNLPKYYHKRWNFDRFKGHIEFLHFI